MSELLPCPFCKGNFIITTRDKNGKWLVVCNEDDADCNMQISTYPCDTPEEARKQWNTRTPSDAAVRACADEINRRIAAVNPADRVEMIASVINSHLAARTGRGEMNDAKEDREQWEAAKRLR